VKLASFIRDGHARFGAALSGERILDLRGAATGAEPEQLAALEHAVSLLDAGPELLELAREIAACADSGSCPAEAVAPLSSVRLQAPVPGARKLLALAGNYQDHIAEGGRPTHAKEETYPYFFMKPPSTSLIGSGEAIVRPAFGRNLDYEGELAVVIGRRGRNIPEGRAMEHVAGYTIVNDVSERALASKDPPRAERERDRFFDWLVGKWYDTSAPCGPWIVTADEIPNPHALRLTTRVNGEVRQETSTGEMIFTVPEIIAWISRVVTLEAGDLIATGTPAGVGSARGVFLQPGDTVEVEIEGIGVLRNPVVAGG
jgi:2-keto-4-pentenoate hydratase/2-oxohepta-3-ene-1,7-dioic acid hydratase in catechol pathway